LIHVSDVLITAIHVLHVVMIHSAMLAWLGSLGIMQIAERALQRLCRDHYKYGQKNVFHSSIIHLYGISEVVL